MSVLSHLRHPDRLFGVIVIMLATVMFVVTGTMAPPVSPGEIAASTYPKILLVSIALLAMVLIVRPVRGEARVGSIVLRGLPVIILTAIYIALIEPLGFFVVTPLFLFVLPLFAGFRDYVLITVSVIVITSLLYGAFVKLLAIPLPPGLLGD